LNQWSGKYNQFAGPGSNDSLFSIMKTKLICWATATMLLALVFEIGCSRSADGNMVAGWGTALNPAEDCEFELTSDRLTIIVPGAETPHDLSSELASSTAPRVLQPVSGDFVIQVRVDGEFQPGTESTQEGRSGYTGAGLLVMADAQNFVRIERATLHYPGDISRPYVNFEIRVNGELKQQGTTGDFPTEGNKPTWLKLERKGQQMLGAMSHDGENWIYGNPKDLSAEAWTQDSIVAGVAAISTSLQTFSPRYSELSVE
jgi:regulation of enolase protein 1 (concanavalin A-like superfamily)